MDVFTVMMGILSGPDRVRWGSRELDQQQAAEQEAQGPLIHEFLEGQANTLESMMGIQYIVNESGDPTAVVVPIDEWRRLLEEVQKTEPERDDTTYLLQSETMRKRLLEAKERSGGKAWEEVQDALGF